MAITRHKRVDKVERTTVSDGTREMAKPASGEVLTALEEWNELNVKKKEMETRLSEYSSTAFLKEQKRIRGRYNNPSTLHLWIDKKSQMESERKKIVDAKSSIEMRMMAIKDKAFQQKRDLVDKREDVKLLESILSVLIEIRDDARLLNA